MSTTKSDRTNVLIVGSGAVGVTAGIEAKEAGAQVTILERESHLGGAAPVVHCEISARGSWPRQRVRRQDNVRAIKVLGMGVRVALSG